MGNPSLNSNAVATAGWLLMNAVRDIDLQCCRTINGVEMGLCNIKRQFHADVEEGKAPPPPRKVCEEDAISWLLGQRLEAASIPAEFWVKYPGQRKTCDIVASLSPDVKLWVEVKLAWKQWFNCSGTHRKSSAYKPYLLGSMHKTHSAFDDFAKMEALCPAEAHAATLLIGFDHIESPMEEEVLSLSRAAYRSGWIGDHLMWHDRRNPSCRIHCWFWHRQLTQEPVVRDGRRTEANVTSPQ